MFQVFAVEVSVDAQHMPLQKLFDLSISRSYTSVNLSRLFDVVYDVLESMPEEDEIATGVGEIG